MKKHQKSTYSLEIEEMLKNSVPPTIIAEEFEVDVAQVLQIQRQLNGTGPKMYDPKLMDEVITDYKNDIPVMEIAKRHGISFNIIYSILHNKEVPLRKTAQADAIADRTLKVVEMYTQGALLDDIMAETGYYQPQVHRILRRYNVPLRRERRKDEKKREEEIAGSLVRQTYPSPYGKVPTEREWPYDTRVAD